jgi:hypothetical protein
LLAAFDHLILAASAGAEVRASWRDALDCGLQDTKKLTISGNFYEVFAGGEGELDVRVFGDGQATVDLAHDSELAIVAHSSWPM